ncbi:MAG: tetratricopeptide repeat protein [Holophaga sp.]
MLPLKCLAIPLLVCSSGFILPAQSSDDPRFLILQGRALQRRGGGDDPAGAAALFRKATTLSPQSAEAHLRLSEALMESGSLEAAVEPGTRATELDSTHAEAWAHLGMLHYLRGRKLPEAQILAQRALQKAAALMPSDAELWTRLAEVAETRKDDAAAIKAWIRVGRLHPPFSIQGKSLGEIAWGRVAALASGPTQYEARREAVLALCQGKYPDAPSLRLLEDLAREQVEKGFLGHAEESFSLLGRHLPKEPAVWDNIAIIQLRTNRFQDALDTLKRAEELRANPRGDYYTGLCLMNLGRFEESEPRWKAVLKASRFTKEDEQLAANARALLATSLLLRGQAQEMLATLKSWAETNTQPELLALQAQGLIQTKAWKQARQVLRDGMARFPGQGIFQLAKAIPADRFDESLFAHKDSRNALQQLDLESMAGQLSEFRRWDRCLEFALQARKTAPVRDVELLLLQGSALQELGRMKEAVQILREGQRMNPGHPTLQNNLGYLLLEMDDGQLQEASALIEASLKQEPKNGNTMDSWGWALFKQGRLKESEEVLRKASEISPFSPEIRKHLGETLLSLGRFEEALEQWERALAYAFPDRKTLENRARELRTRIAKNRHDASLSNEEPPPVAPELELEEGPE